MIDKLGGFVLFIGSIIICMGSCNSSSQLSKKYLVLNKMIILLSFIDNY